MKKIKMNIILIFVGLLLVSISLGIGFLNNFSGEQDGTGLMLSIGGGALFAGIVLTPKLLKSILYFIDMITMFFSGSK